MVCYVSSPRNVRRICLSEALNVFIQNTIGQNEKKTKNKKKALFPLTVAILSPISWDKLHYLTFWDILNPMIVYLQLDTLKADADNIQPISAMCGGAAQKTLNLRIAIDGVLVYDYFPNIFKN